MLELSIYKASSPSAPFVPTAQLLLASLLIFVFVGSAKLSQPTLNMLSTLKLDRSIFFKLDEVRYVCRPSILHPKFQYDMTLKLVHDDKPKSDTKFLTILKYDSQIPFQFSWLQRKLEETFQKDDVLHKEFLQTLLLSNVSSREETDPSGEITAMLKFWNIGKIGFIPSGEDCSVAGPFLIKDDGHLWPVMRLYEDTKDAFLIPVIANDGETFEVCNDGNHGWSNCALAVPSRLFTPMSTSKPLAGVRIALKDAFDLRGVKSSICSRAYL